MILSYSSRTENGQILMVPIGIKDMDNTHGDERKMKVYQPYQTDPDYPSKTGFDTGYPPRLFLVKLNFLTCKI